MTGDIIRLHGDQHLEAQSLLPWYVTDRLDAAERAQVAAHLDACSECQAELKIEQSLRAAVAELRMDVEQDWAKLRARLERETPRRAATRPRPFEWRAWLGAVRRAAGGPWLPWAVLAQAGLLMMLAGALVTTARPARYHVLGAAPSAAAGNVVVIFRPQTSEAALRGILQANHARLVDGPTSTGAWLLHVPTPRRAVALASLRRQAQIELAEPVDSGDSR